MTRLLTVLFILSSWIASVCIHEFGHALAALAKLLAVVLVLNLLPIPPLDGFRILSHWLPEETSQRGYALGWAPVMVLYLILSQPTPIADGFWQLTNGLAMLLRLPTGYAEYALGLLSLQ